MLFSGDVGGTRVFALEQERVKPWRLVTVREC
jgi:hypothetical protein